MKGIWFTVPECFYGLFIDRRWFHRLRYWRKIRKYQICSCCIFSKVVQNEDHNNIGVCANEKSDFYEQELYPDDTCKLWERATNCTITWCKNYFKCCEKKVDHKGELNNG